MDAAAFWLAQAAIAVWASTILGCDLRWRRIPNALVLAGVALGGLLLALTLSPYQATWPAAVIWAIAAPLLALPFYALGVLGAGDVKLLAPLGLLLGGSSLAVVLLGGTLLGGMYAIFLLARRRVPRMAQVAPRRRREVPYGACLAGAVLALQLGHGLAGSGVTSGTGT